MKKLLLLFFVSVSLLSFSQKWCSPGSQWYYGSTPAYNTTSAGYIQISNTGDTVINSTTCNKLVRTWYWYDELNKNYHNEVLGESYTYADPNVIYVFGRNNAFDTLYDFGATPGERWTAYGPIYYGNKCDSTGIVRVDSIGATKINGLTLRYICVSIIDTEQHWGLSSKIVEKVGPIKALGVNPYQSMLSYMFPQKFDYCGMQIDAIQEGADFRCYSDSSGFSYKGDTVTVACDFILTSILSLANSQFINVSPNPSNGKFILQISNNEYRMTNAEVYNELGQQVYSQPLRQAQGDNTIDLSNQPAGIYLYRVISDKGEYIASGKLVIE